MCRVVRLKSSGKILGANSGEVILDKKHFSFLMQVIDTLGTENDGSVFRSR